MSAPPVVEDAVVVGEEDPMFLDEEAMLAARPDGSLPQNEMIQIVKDALLASGGIGLPEAMLAPDFIFEGPVVGPFSKTEFLDAIGKVDFKGAEAWSAQFAEPEPVFDILKVKDVLSNR